MDKYLIKEYQQRVWSRAEVFKNGVKIADINNFHEVTPDWIIIYETIGSSGTGYRKGDVIFKISIAGAEFSKEIINEIENGK